MNVHSKVVADSLGKDEQAQQVEELISAIEKYGDRLLTTIRVLLCKGKIVSREQIEEYAKDILQETLQTAWEKVREFDAEKSRYAWLQKIAYHKVLQFRDKRITEKSFVVLVSDTNEAKRESAKRNNEYPSEDDLFSLFVGSDENKKLIEEKFTEIMSVVNESDRETLQSYYIEGYETHELMVQWNLSEAGVHKRLSRARRNAREAFYKNQ